MKKKIMALLMSVVTAGMMVTGSVSAYAEDASAEETTDESTGEVSATLQKYIDQGYITIGTSNDAPISYLDTETGKWTGFDADIFTEACNRLGIKEVKVETMDFSELIVALNSNKIDMIVDCMMIKPERAEQCYFSDYLYQNSEVLVVPEDSPIESKDDLTGDEVIGCTTGTTFLATAQEWESEGVIKEARPMGDQTELLLNVQTGKIDGCLTDAYVIEYMISVNNEEVAGLKECSNYKPEGAAGNAYACRFDDMEMMPEFNKVFADMRAEGEINRILESYDLSTELHALTQEEAEHNLNTK